jgi:secreted Zn-dependent insulinase-like peptidase
MHFKLDLIQYEQIKDEFIKQNGLELILRCVTESKFKSPQILQPALEILLALTFHKEAFQQLKQNLNQIKSCLSSSYQEISHPLEYIL